MAYRINDDENRIQDLKDQIDQLEVQTFSPEVVGRNESTRNTGIESGDSAALNAYPQWIPIRDYGTLGDLTLLVDLKRVDGHVAKMTLNGDTTFAFAFGPKANKMMDFILDVTIDNTGGYTILFGNTIVPASTSIDNTANTRTVIRFTTTDGGITYYAEILGGTSGGGDAYTTIQEEGTNLIQRRIMNFIGPGVIAVDNPANDRTDITITGGGGTGNLSNLIIDVKKDWLAQGISNFGALSGVTELDMDGVTATIVGVQNIDLFQTGQSIESIAGEVKYNTANLASHAFYSDGTKIAEFVEETAGDFRLNMFDHTIKDAKEIRFDPNGIFEGPVNVPTIGYDVGEAELLYNAPDAAKHVWTTNNIELMGLNASQLTFAQGLKIQANPNATNPGLSVGIHTADPTSTTNGDLWYRSDTNKLRTKQNNVDVDVVGGSGGSPTVLDNLTEVDHGTIGVVSENFDWSEGNFHRFVANGDVTVGFTNLPISTKWSPFLLKITQDGTGGHDITFAQSFENGDPFVDTTANIITVLKFYAYNDGVNSIIRQGDWDESGGKNNNLGNIQGSTPVDFDIFDDRQLYGNQIGSGSALTLNFSNIPNNLSCNVKLYMTPADANASLTLAGVTGSTLIYDSTNDPFNIKPLATNDFLSIEFESTDNSSITIISVKKNDDSSIAPGIPGTLYSIGNSASTVFTSWDQPEIGTLPITYTIAWSTSPAGNPVDGPTTVTGSVSDIEENIYQTTGLNSATAYYFWVRGTNSIGSGNWAGPQQTNTEGISNAGDTGFAVNTATFGQAVSTWNNVAGALFTAFRTDNDGVSNRVNYVERTAGAGNIVDTFAISPDTPYKFTLETYNEFNYQLATQTITSTSADIPIPTFVLSVTGQILTFAVTFPANISLATIEWALDAAFTTGVVTRTFGRSVGDWTIPSVQNFITQKLESSTTYYGRVKFVVAGIDGTFAPEQNVTTSAIPIPDEFDAFDDINISGDANGLIRFDINFGNSSSVGESAQITLRDAGSVGEYFSYPGLVLSRDNPPSDDLDPGDEDEIQVVRGGGGWGAKGIITVVSGAVTAINVTFGGKDYLSNQQIRIYDDDDTNYQGFRGTAVVNGVGQLTSVNITNGGDFYDNGNEVLLVGYANENGSTTTPWQAGNAITLRAVASNTSGSSEADFLNTTIGLN